MSQPHLDGVLKLDELSAELTHETFEADTKDREDHTFSGIMFDVACQSLPRGPVEYIEVQSVAVRGQLGPLTVWSTEGGFTGKHERKDEWTLRYESVHPASPSALVELRLSQPVRLRLGERCGLYVHSALPGDEGIVYDDQHQRLTYEDPTFKVFPGRAHLSSSPFSRRGMWPGSSWRTEREFVGQLRYGVRWRMWTPQVHADFPPPFRRAVLTMLMGTRRAESLLYLLDEELVFFIMNKCFWSDFGVGALGRGGRAGREERHRRLSGSSSASSTAARKRRALDDSDDSDEDEDGDGAAAQSSARRRKRGKRRRNPQSTRKWW